MMRTWAMAGVMAVLLAAPPALAQPRQAARDDSLAYTVQSGDTLSGLGAYLNRHADYRLIQRDNRVADPRRMAVGRVLLIPVRLLRADPDQARVAGFRGAATLTRNGTQGPIATGQGVSEGDVLTTGANAFIRLALSDGSHVTVPSNSRIRLLRLRRYALNGAVDHGFAVQAGRIESTVTPRRRPGGFVIETPVSVSAVRGTEFRVAFDATTERASTGVIEGVVNVRSGDGAASVAAEASEGVSVTRGAVRLADLLPAPELIDPDQVHSAPDVRMQLAHLADARTYRGRLALDAGMIEAFAEVDSSSGADVLVFPELADGAYFVRLTALAEDGLEGRPATYAFIRARNGIGGLAADLASGDRRRPFRFRWSAEGEGQAVFRFQLSREDDEGAPLIDQPGLTEEAFTVTDLPAGVYTWRVQSSRHRFGRLLQAWSEPQQLRIGR